LFLGKFALGLSFFSLLNVLNPQKTQFLDSWKYLERKTEGALESFCSVKKLEVSVPLNIEEILAPGRSLGLGGGGLQGSGKMGGVRKETEGSLPVLSPGLSNWSRLIDLFENWGHGFRNLKAPVSSPLKRPAFKFVRVDGRIQGSVYSSLVAYKVPKKIASLVTSFTESQVKKSGSFSVFYRTSLSKKGLPLRQELLYGCVGSKASGVKRIYGLALPGRKGSLSGVYDELGNHLLKGQKTSLALFQRPVLKGRLSSTYGLRKHPVLGRYKMHFGIDFASPYGTPVYAAQDGIVSKAFFNGTFGRYILVRHGKNLSTAYAHLSRFAPQVKPGKIVKKGGILGYVGNSGRTRGAHLHFELIQGNRRINPISVLSKGGSPSIKSVVKRALPSAFKGVFSKQVASIMEAYKKNEKFSSQGRGYQKGVRRRG
jgi:murein DD-endopeptidase MepM/ murein hydrolase activator NlpD